MHMSTSLRAVVINHYSFFDKDFEVPNKLEASNKFPNKLDFFNVYLSSYISLIL